ncbi:MAG: zinc-binding dehydrogenase [Spirochaetales bacterium]|nr:zinc-binding dehydrogenase [Spirochaetales bacterium]
MDSHDVRPNELVLIHAASGGVGQILTQICKLKGAVVIGLTRNEDKIPTILENNADYALILNDDWRSRVMSITRNSGVDVVYDSVGSTLADSIAVTKERGHIVFYGMSGGDPSPVDPRVLLDASQTLTGGDLWSYLTSKEERMRRANLLFAWLETGEISIKEPKIFRLSEGRKAHEYLENGNSAGKVLLIPDSHVEQRMEQSHGPFVVRHGDRPICRTR